MHPYFKLLAVLAAAMSVASGVGPLKMIDMLQGPPATIIDCLDRMKAKMEMKVTMMEQMMDAKWECKASCLSEEQIKCLPGEAFKAKLKDEQSKLKTEFMAARDNAMKCVLGKIGNGCSKTPIRWGMCGIAMAKKILGPEANMCMGKCIVGKAKESLKTIITEMAGKPGCPPVDAIAKMRMILNQQTRGTDGGIARMIKRMGKRMLNKGMCIMQFCEIDALMDCAESSGLQKMYKKKIAMKQNMIKMMEESMFPDVCSCLKKSAQNLPDYLASFNCENKPNIEVCGKLQMEYMDKRMKEIKEAQITARKKREVSNFFGMEDEIDEIDDSDAFDLE